MGEFKRSPSKVWWASESVDEYREVSESPGQDSGFSDSEHSPPITTTTTSQTTATSQTDLIKKTPLTSEKLKNLSINCKEKILPEKQFDSESSPITITKSGRFTKNSPRVSRNLFSTRQKECVVVFNNHHQYAKDVNKNATITTFSSVCKGITLNESLDIRCDTPTNNLNKSAPAILLNNHNDDDDEESLNDCNYSLSSDCESELECLFDIGLELPKHTSTPKSMNGQQYYKRGRNPLNLYQKYQQDKRVPLIISELTDNEAVKKWMEEERQFYEQECMTTLQCKSIAAELNLKVTHMASYKTHTIRNILSQSNCIQTEYKKLNSEKKHVNPLAQSLAGNIVDFLRNFSEITPDITDRYDEIRKSDAENSLKSVLKLFNYWQNVYLQVLLDEIKKLMAHIENPRSELELRSIITGITSISLHNEELIETFTKFDIVPILLILCEKCDGSSLRSQLLRCLSTMCCNRFAIRQFEKYSGIQIINDTLDDGTRPEPERSEAVALLAQITAPWIEDNHSIRGLSDYSKKLIKSLTKFLTTTKCCQNLLLCIAALANLTTMDPKSIKFIMNQDTIRIIFDILNKRALRVSVYILEQIATLIVNLTAFDLSRQYLIKHQAPAVLLYCLRVNTRDRDVEKRLQQKSMIALSRLCSDRQAAEQIVHLNGVEKLVKLCRNKNERFDNDAVLVATLATLRKITDVCGNRVINAEDAQELVEPKLLDSFLAYSTQSESYV